MCVSSYNQCSTGSLNAGVKTSAKCLQMSPGIGLQAALDQVHPTLYGLIIFSLFCSAMGSPLLWSSPRRPALTRVLHSEAPSARSLCQVPLPLPSSPSAWLQSASIPAADAWSAWDARATLPSMLKKEDDSGPFCLQRFTHTEECKELYGGSHSHI